MPPCLEHTHAVIPIHYAAYKHGPLLGDAAVNRSELMRLTIAAVPLKSPIYWFHFVLVVLYNVYAMCVLFWHFRQYVIIRHSYLTRGAGGVWGGALRLLV